MSDFATKKTVKPTYHELDSQTVSAFLSILKDADFQPESDEIELNRLYHCRTGKKKDRRFAWYQLYFSKDDKAFIGTYGSFTMPKQTAEFPAHEPETPEERERAERRRQAAEQKRAEQQAAALLSDFATRFWDCYRAEQTAELAKQLLDAGNADSLPEYLANKNLPLVAPAKAISGRDLLRLLPTTQKKVRDAIQRVTNQSTRLFLLVPIYRHSGALSNVQIILPEKVDIHNDGKPGNKLFLAGKGTLSGAYLALTPLSDVPNGSELLLFEGYAKAIPAHLLGKPALVAFFVGNIDNVAKLFCPAEYPNKDAWQKREKALTFPRRFTVRNCADNDAAALTVAKKVKWRVKSVFPVFPGVKDWDDLYRVGGLEEVERQLDEPRHLDAVYHALTPEQFIADLKLSYPDGISWLISDTGNGKTREVCRYADANPNELTVLIAPTNMICEQTAKALKDAGKPFQLVMGTRAMRGLSVAKEYQYDAPGLCVTTLAKFVSSFDVSGCYYPVTLFVDEAHTFSSDSYRQADIAACYAMFPAAKKVVLLTATPYFYHNSGLQAAPKIFVEKAGKPKTRVKLLYFRDETATVKHFAEKGRVIVEINSRTGMNTLAKFLRKCGVSGVYTLSADDKEATDKASIYRHILDHECLPADCRVLLTTKIYEMGINLRDTDISAFLIFGKRSLNSNRACDAIPAPADVKQGANRTRAAAPPVFYCLPETMQNDDDTAFYAAGKYAKLLKRAERQAAEYADETYTAGRAAALAEYNTEMREHAPRLLSWEQAAPVVSVVGVDMAVNECYRAALLYSGAFLRRELNKYGLQFDGELTFDELTNGGACSSDDDKAADSQALSDAREETAADADAAFTQDVADMAAMTDEQLKRHNSRHADKMQFFRRMASREQAAALLLTVGREGRAFSQVRSRLTVLKAMTRAAKARKRLDTAAALMAFLKQGTFKGKDAAECVTAIFGSDRVLRHELDTEWKTGNTRRLTAKRALSVLRKFKDVDKQHTETGTVYRVSDNRPLVTLWQTATGNAPFSSVFFQAWLNEKPRIFEPSSPVSVGDTPDTLQKSSLYRNENVNVSGMNDLQEYVASELSEYAREQIAIHGDVF